MIGIDKNMPNKTLYTNKDVKDFATQAAKDALRDILKTKKLSPEAEKELEVLAKNLGGLLSNNQVLKNIKGGDLA